MLFEIQNKVALVTGGASGIGREIAIELLKRGAKGVTVVDINDDLGHRLLKEIKTSFGENKIIFMKTDITIKDDLERAIEKCIEHFHNLDIVINSAGIANDKDWEKAISVNIKGVINGTILALDKYIPQYKSEKEGVIINISSVAGLNPTPAFPIYSGTKAAIIGMSVAWGHKKHYDATKVKVLTVCPGVTETPLIQCYSEFPKVSLGERYNDFFWNECEKHHPQSPSKCALGIMEVLETAQSGTVWVIENGENPYEYRLTNREEFHQK